MAKLEKMTCTEDFRQVARQSVPRMFYDYVDSGSWTERTYRANEADFQQLKFRQKVAIDFSSRSIASRLLGEDVAMPAALAPTGLTGMQRADGEILAARAAEGFGIPFTLSTMSICSIEDVAAHTHRPFWFQLYVMRDREFIAHLIERARVARCSALVVTVDLQVSSQRNKDIKNGLSAPPRFTGSTALDFLRCPRWSLGMLRTQRRTFGNIIGHAKGVKDIRSMADWSAEQFDPTLSWRDIEWIKEQWGGKLIIKGVMDADDARLAVQAGADAVIVSNHGGRQLDGAPSSISALPAIVGAVGNETEVWMDGGVRSGQDMLSALALGAKGVMIGRAFLYALGAFGQPGVARCLALMAKELDLSMAFCGRTRIEGIDRSVLINPDLWD